MKRISLHILAFILLNATGVYSQEVILADRHVGCDSLTVQFTLKNALELNDYTSVVWQFGDGNVAAGALSVTHTYTAPGVYDVRCVFDGARVVEEQNFITLSITPTADFTIRDISEVDNELQIELIPDYFVAMEGANLTYLWKRLSDTLIVTDEVAMYFFEYPNEKELDTIFLSITDQYGCRDSIFKCIPIVKTLLVSNFFSPNGDGINDYFEVTAPTDYHYHFRIFSPAGLQVYYSFSPTISWDGRTAGGNEVKEGVYYYVIERDEMPFDERVCGFIHLFR